MLKVEAVGNLSVGVAERDQAQNLSLALAEAVTAGLARAQRPSCAERSGCR